MNSSRIWVGLPGLILQFGLTAQTLPVPLSSNPQRLETVADLWGRVYLFHPAIPSQGIDWQGALVKALPSIERASSTEEFATALNEHLLSILKDPAVFVRRREANKIDTPTAATRLLSERLGYLDLRNQSIAGTSSTALKSAVGSLGAIDSLVLDLRWVMPDDFDPPSADWLRQFLFAPTQVGPVVNRVHEGWNEFNTPGTYQQRWSLQSPRLLRAPDEPIRLKLIVLVNNKSYYACEPYLDALQSSSHAAVVWEQTANFLEGPYGQRRGVVRYAENIEFRLPHQSFISHTGALRFRPDLILRSVVRDQDLSGLARSVLTGSLGPAKSEPPFSYQIKLGEPPREAIANPTREERLLGLIKIWNVVRYLYPYLDLASTDWRKYLRDWAPKVERVSTVGEYYSILNESVTPLNDGHVMVRHRLSRRAVAIGTTPYRLAKIDGTVIVAAVMAGKDTGALKVGDEVVSIDGEPVADIEAKHRKQDSVSTPDALYRFWAFIAGPLDKLALFEIRRSGVLHRISVERSLPNFGGPPTWQESAPVKEISGDIGYLNLRTISSEGAFRQAFSGFRNKRGLVLDMRGNPAIFMGDWIATRLSPLPVSVGHSETPLVFSHDLLHRSVIRHPAMVAPDPDQFAGKVVALIETGPQSAAETMVGALKSTGRVTLVGTRTTGTNGGTTQIYLPAGGSMQLTGQRSLFPDGSRFQGVGYTPDVLAAPTIKGIVAGRDEVLEKGIETVKALIQSQER